MDKLQVNLTALQKDHWSEEQLKNAKIVSDFVQHLMNDHNFELVREKYGKDPYKQHNQTMTDGLEGVLGFVSNFVKRFPDYGYDVKHIYVDGSFVTLHSHVTTKAKHRGNPKKGLNIMDIWRVEHGAIVEHWDSVQPIHGSLRFLFWMIGGKFQNTNTYF